MAGLEGWGMMVITVKMPVVIRQIDALRDNQHLGISDEVYEELTNARKVVSFGGG